MQTENRKCYFSLQEGHGSVWWFHWLIPPCLISAEHLGSNDTNISNKKKKKDQFIQPILLILSKHSIIFLLSSTG